jgi:hypothetical protein
MPRILLLFSFVSLISNQLQAQERIPAQLQNHRFYVSIIEPGISWEAKLSEKQSFVSGFGVTTLTAEENNPEMEELGVSLNPLLTGEIRNYYSRKKVKKALNTNSGNYIALRAGYYFGSIADNIDNGGTTEISNAFFMGPVWGIQRNYKSGIHLGLSIGGGFATGKFVDFKAVGIGQFKFGFVIGQ